MPRSSQEEPRDEHASEEQRHHLERVPPCRCVPVLPLVSGEPQPRGEKRDGESRPGEDPLQVVDALPEGVRRLRRGPVGEHEKNHHARHVDDGLPQRTAAVVLGNLREPFLSGLLLLAEDRGHQQADDHAEEHRPHRARNAEFKPEYPCREDDGEHVDRGTGVEEGRSGAEPGAPHVDAGEEGKHRARADREYRTGDRGHGVGDPLLRLRSQVLHHRLLAHEDRDGPRDEERGDQAEQHVLPRVVGHHGHGLRKSRKNSLVLLGDEIERQKKRGYPKEFFTVAHSALLSCIHGNHVAFLPLKELKKTPLERGRLFRSTLSPSEAAPSPSRRREDARPKAPFRPRRAPESS